MQSKHETGGQPSEQLEQQPGQLCLLESVRVKGVSRLTRRLTLTSSPAQADATATDREALHLLDCPFGVSLAYELNETAMFAHWHLNLYQSQH